MYIPYMIITNCFISISQFDQNTCVKQFVDEMKIMIVFCAGQLLGNFPLSGFTRCLFLQALLEDEKIVVVLKNSQQNGKFISPSKVNNAVYHPRYTGGRDTQVMLVSLHTTVSEVTSKVTGRSHTCSLIYVVLLNLFLLFFCYNIEL